MSNAGAADARNVQINAAAMERAKPDVAADRKADILARVARHLGRPG
jgi:hypothetical protein